MTDCPLCQPPAAAGLLWRDHSCHVVLAGDPDYPGFCRVVWREHRRELTDLLPADRGHLLAVIGGVEAALRALLAPDKINLAAFGNQVPHLHWHVIPRFADDAHFPDPTWAPRRRDGRRYPVDTDALRARLAATLP